MNERWSLTSPIRLIVMLALLVACTYMRADDPQDQDGQLESKNPFDLIESFLGSGNKPNNATQGNLQPDEAQLEPDSGVSDDSLIPFLGSQAVEVEKEAGTEVSSAPRRAGERIEAVDGFEKGRQLALLEQRPLLVVVGAQWCTWCRQLEDQLTQADAEPILRRWVVTKVDSDRDPETAGKLRVSALPALRVIDTSGDVIAERSGYMAVPELHEWLNQHADQADPVVSSVLFASGAPDADGISQLVSLLSRRDASVRAAAAGRLSDHPSVAAGAVVDQLRSGSLSARLAALEILASWRAPVEGIDPWEPGTINDQTTTQLITWLRDQSTQPGSTTDQIAADPKQAGPILRELIDASEFRHAELMQRAIAIGNAAATEAKRIETTVESLNDSQRQLLRHVRYSVLAGQSTRLANSGLIESLAQLDGPTHYSAAEKLLPNLTSQDQPLVDELSIDRDPLVRELAVDALQRIGALTSSDRMRRLLADESPSVRTAVLRQIATHPDDEVTQRLVEYLQTEPDENLLIYATKTLGKLATSPLACSALADLMKHDRWRVRAAALDAVNEFVDENSYAWGSDYGDSGVSEAIADAVLARTDDSDGFVANQAQYLLPHVISKRTAEAVAKFLLSDLDRAHQVIQSVDEYERGRRMVPLIDLSKQWLEGSDPKQHADAALLMTEISPTTLRYRLDDLLQSDDTDVRIAALRAFIPCMTEFRQQAIEQERENWQLAFSTSEGRAIREIELIRPVPDCFRPPANTETSIADTEREFEPREPQAIANSAPVADDSLDAISSFFGASPTTQVDPDEGSKPISVSEEPGETSTLDLAASLFGNSPPPQSPRADAEGDNEEHSKPSDIDPTLMGRLSYWMERWQRHDSSIARPTWIRSCEPILRQLVDSSDPRERLWAKAALLTCGEVTGSDQLVRLPAVATADNPSEELVLSWLPPHAQVDWIRNHVDQLNAKDMDKKVVDAWTAATLVDSIESANIIESSLQQSTDLSNEAAAFCALSLRRTLVGGWMDNEFGSVSTDELQRVDDEPLARRKIDGMYPQQSDAVRWLMDRYRAASSDQHRAVLLAVLAYQSRMHATAEALAIVEEAIVDSAVLDTATALALGDLPPLSVDRAVVLLSHSNAGVVDAALRRLSGEDDASSDEMISTPYVYAGTDQQHPLQMISRPLPSATLARLSQGEDELSAAISETLLLSLGNEPELDSLLDRLSGLERPLTFVAIALAKAARTDDAAIDLYRRSAEAVEYYESGPLLNALRSLRDDRVKQITKTHLQDSAGFFSF